MAASPHKSRWSTFKTHLELYSLDEAVAHVIDNDEENDQTIVIILPLPGKTCWITSIVKFWQRLSIDFGSEF